MKIFYEVMKVARRLKREGYGSGYRRIYLEGFIEGFMEAQFEAAMDIRIEIAKRLLLANVEVGLISKSTDLSIEKLDSLSRNYNNHHDQLVIVECNKLNSDNHCKHPSDELLKITLDNRTALQ